MSQDHETHAGLHMQALAKAMMQTKETMLANIFKSAFEERTFETECIVEVDFDGQD